MGLYVITGPPAAGKSKWVRSHAKTDDITIDFDRIAATLTPNPVEHDPPRHIVDVAMAARRAAVTAAMRQVNNVDVYIIHSMPSVRQVDYYQRNGGQMITLNPGREECMARAAASNRPNRSFRIIDEWYSRYATPAYAKADW